MSNVVRATAGIALAVLLTAVSAPAVANADSYGQERTPAPEQKIDVNTADLRLLQTVPGIGPAMARRIVDWREEHGRFERIEDLLDIRGIGDKTLDRFREWLEVREPDEDEDGRG